MENIGIQVHLYSSVSKKYMCMFKDFVDIHINIIYDKITLSVPSTVFSLYSSSMAMKLLLLPVHVSLRVPLSPPGYSRF